VFVKNTLTTAKTASILNKRAQIVRPDNIKFFTQEVKQNANI